MSAPAPNPGSFKDPASRVYHCGGRILRGLNRQGADTFAAAEKTFFLSEWMQNGKIAETWRPDDDDARAIIAEGWADVIEHRPVPFVSYPYEWPFAMLKDAALLHLELLAQAAENNWMLKDATPYNIQWRGASPMLIDIPSLQPRAAGAPWAAYRQFCMTFLFPLMLRAHLNINSAPLMRAELDGVAASEMLHYFSGFNLLKKGVLPHIIFPALAEKAAIKKGIRRAAEKESNAPPPRQPEAIVMGLIRGMQNTVRSLRRRRQKTNWSDYEHDNSYGDSDSAAKKEFVGKHAASRRWNLIWDLGCNTGTYSRVCAAHAGNVVAVDGDDEAIERLYLSQRGGGNILPLTMNFANMSPSQGWDGRERAAFDGRGRPDMIVCLALLHHLRIAANIPLAMILDFLRKQNAALLAEFVGRDDPMTWRLLQNKSETYDDYCLDNFESELRRRFEVEDRRELKDGARVLYFARPR